MAKLYEKLQKSLISYEDRPKELITEQTFFEALFIIRGKDQGASAWHYILVPVSKVADLKALQPGSTIDATKFGHVIQYRNYRNEVMPMSGWGRDPPKMLHTWINKHYGSATIGENTNMKYKKDDIRLCTMQRAIPKQRLGFSLHYYQRERFYFIKFNDDFESSLAYRAGIKDYDRIIYLNGINIENDTFTQLMDRFNVQRHLPVQMLVCSPATYIHYKTHKKILHSDLPTIQHVKPVYTTLVSDSNSDKSVISVDNQSFCAMHWENSSIISTVSQSMILKSPEFIQINDICFVKVKGQYRKGKVIAKGSREICEKFKTPSALSITTRIFNKLANIFVQKKQKVLNSTIDSISDFTDCKPVSLLNTSTTLSSEKLSQMLQTNSIPVQITIQDNNDGVHTALERLPNELFFYLFTFIDIQHLYNAFWGLNSRLNNLLRSCPTLSLIFDEKIDRLFMKPYTSYVVRLTIDTSINCDLNQFPNLQRLILCNENSKHLEKIQPKILPNLTHLSFFLGSKFTPSSKLVHNVFSNKFPSLSHVNLGRIIESFTYRFSTSPSLQFVSICSSEPMIIQSILTSCPNLHHLQLQILDKNHFNILPSPLLNHPLQRLTLWSHLVELTFDNVDSILTHTPNVQHLYLQTVYHMPFVDLLDGLVKRLHHLSRFDCFVKEMIVKDARIGDLTNIHSIHFCFNQIQCIEEYDNFRIFATK